MRVPRRRLVKSAAKRVAREGPREGRQAPTPKRPATQVPEPVTARAPPRALEIDLTSDASDERDAAAGVTVEVPTAAEPAAAADAAAETEPAPMDEGAAETEPVAEEPAAGEPAAAVEVPAPHEPSPTGASRDWGEGPSEPVRSSPRGAPAGAYPLAGSDTNGESQARRGPSRGSGLDDGRRVEQLISSIFLPELQEELSHMKAATFFRESYADLIKVANSLDVARGVIRGGKTVIREAQKEAEDARARAEAAEGALELARTARAVELEEAEVRAEVEFSRTQEALRQLAEARSALAASDLHISELAATIQMAENRAIEAGSQARAAEKRAEEAEEKVGVATGEIREVRERAEKAEEERRLALETLAAERAALAAEVEIAVKARTARVLEEFRASEGFVEELTEASTGAYLDGFQRGKEKVAQDLNFPQALEVEPDRLSEMSTSDDEPAPTEP